jgi:hypothetical protein
VFPDPAFSRPAGFKKHQAIGQPVGMNMDGFIFLPLIRAAVEAVSGRSPTFSIERSLPKHEGTEVT